MAKTPSLKIARGEKGRQFAEAVLLQNDSDNGPLGPDAHITNPVLRRLREQARAGVGSQPGELPAAWAAHLADRAFGKESEKLAVQQTGRPFEELTTEQLAARVERMQRELRGETNH